MPAKDQLHEAVVRALLKDGWRILSNQPTVRFNSRILYIDVVAEKDGSRIAVEIKGTAFEEMAELEKAIGQFILYRFVLAQSQSDTTIFLAAPQKAFEKIFGASHKDGPALADELNLNFLVFDPTQEEIIQWIQR